MKGERASVIDLYTHRGGRPILSRPMARYLIDLGSDTTQVNPHEFSEASSEDAVARVRFRAQRGKSETVSHGDSVDKQTHLKGNPASGGRGKTVLSLGFRAKVLLRHRSRPGEGVTNIGPSFLSRRGAYSFAAHGKQTYSPKSPEMVHLPLKQIYHTKTGKARITETLNR